MVSWALADPKRTPGPTREEGELPAAPEAAEMSFHSHPS